jgi:benzylsuccinate synthase
MSQVVLNKALRCIRAGLAMPSFKNDDVAIGTLLDFGASLEEARNWCLTLCMSPGCCGRKGTRIRNPWSTVTPKMLELALNDGYDGVWKAVGASHW